MKILLFENGEPGRMTDILGENVQGELEELLGGPIEWKRLSARLRLVVHADGEKLALPIRYTRYKPGNVPEIIRGNAAVVRVSEDGTAHDLTRADAEDVSLWLHLAEA